MNKLYVGEFNIISRDHRREFEFCDISAIPSGFEFISKEKKNSFEAELEGLMDRYFSDGTVDGGFEVHAVGVERDK